jgi:hypothetical protein
MAHGNHPHNPEKKGSNPTLVIVILVTIIALVAVFLYLRPTPPGAIDSQPSPASAPK